MKTIEIVEREMSAEEFAAMNAGFDRQTEKFGNTVETAERFGFVATQDRTFIGCASGLAYRRGDAYRPWAFITDLFVEEDVRGTGVGGQLLGLLEGRFQAIGVTHIYTWTAGFEAPEFYAKQGYDVFTELEDWFESGHARVGLRKELNP